MKKVYKVERTERLSGVLHKFFKSFSKACWSSLKTRTERLTQRSIIVPDEERLLEAMLFSVEWKDPLGFSVDLWGTRLQISAKIKIKIYTKHCNIIREKNTYLMIVVNKENPSRTEQKKVIYFSAKVKSTKSSGPTQKVQLLQYNESFRTYGRPLVEYWLDGSHNSLWYTVGSMIILIIYKISYRSYRRFSLRFSSWVGKNEKHLFLLLCNSVNL